MSTTRDLRTPSSYIDEERHHKAIHVVNSLKDAPNVLPPPLPKPNSRPESPKFMIHHPHAAVAHQPFDQTVLIRKLSTLEPVYQHQGTQHSDKDREQHEQESHQSSSAAPVNTDVKVLDDILTLPLSSPCSVSDPMAIDKVLNGDDQAPEPTQDSMRRVSSGSVHVQPLAMEELPQREQKSARQKLSFRKIESGGKFRRRGTSDQLISEGGGSVDVPSSSPAPFSTTTETVLDGSIDEEQAVRKSPSKRQ